MRNKSLLAVLLSALLILAGAMLPRVLMNMQDASIENKVEFGVVSNIQLEFVQSSVSMPEILGIAARSTHSVEIPSDLSVYTEADIKRIAQQTIEKYQSAGLILHTVDMDTHLHTILPRLLYEQASTRKSNIFWDITFSPSDQSWSLNLMIDDKTGRVCSINYSHAKGDDPAAAEPLYSDLDEILSVFRDLFLNGLGEDFTSSDANLVEEGTSISMDEGFASTSVSWADSIRGECHIVFYVLDTSFYTILY